MLSKMAIDGGGSRQVLGGAEFVVGRCTQE